MFTFLEISLFLIFGLVAFLQPSYYLGVKEMTDMKENMSQKKKIIALGGMAIALILVISPVNLFAQAGESIFKSSESKTLGAKVYITKDEAIQIALDKIDGPAKLVEIELDDENGQVHYEIEMVDEGLEYELDIDAVNGKVLKFQKEIKREQSDQASLSEEEAIKFALEKIGSQANVKKVDLDQDDGIVYYDIDLFDDSHEYEIEIHASTGQVLKFEQDSKDQQLKNASNFMTKEAAIDAALGEIGKKASLSKVELDSDDFLPYYEVKMFDETFDYEIEIHASSGKVLNFEKELRENTEGDNQGVLDVKYISESAAIQIALDKIGANARVLEIELEKDDNPSKYELELTDGTYEYEVEIHAVSGVIIDFEKELD